MQQVRISGAEVRRDPLLTSYAGPIGNIILRTHWRTRNGFSVPDRQHAHRRACCPRPTRAEPGKLYLERHCLPFVLAWLKARASDAQPCRTMLMERCQNSKTRRSTVSRSKSGSVLTAKFLVVKNVYGGHESPHLQYTGQLKRIVQCLRGSFPVRNALGFCPVRHYNADAHWRRMYVLFAVDTM